MAKFRKGDVCIVINAPNVPELIGAELALTSDGFIPSVEAGYPPDMLVYETDLIFRGYPCTAAEYCLKLKKFDGEDLITKMFENPLTQAAPPVKITEIAEEIT